MIQEDILKILEQSQNEFVGVNESNLHSADIIAFKLAETTKQIAIDFGNFLFSSNDKPGFGEKL